MNRRQAALMFVLLVALAAPPRQAGATAPVRVAITSVSGRDVFIDAGSAAGITPGLHVRFFPTGAPPFEAVVADVSSGSARVQLSGATLPPRVGNATDCLVVLFFTYKRQIFEHRGGQIR